MAKIQRTQQKIFGGNAPADDIAALGSFKTGAPVYTDNISDLQNEAYEQGYSSALVANEAPFMEEQNSIPYILSKQLAYLFQEGIAEYDSATSYYIGSMVKTLNNQNVPVLYFSLTDDNTGNPLTDTTHWREISLGSGGGGSDLPLFTPMLFDHVLEGDEAIGWALQGSLITMTYPQAVQKIKDAYASGTEITHRGIVCKRATDGRYIADISQKEAVDALFAETGIAKFYILDEANNQFYLPRENKFCQLTNETENVNGYNEPGLPNITGTIGRGSSDSIFWTNAAAGASGAFKMSENRASMANTNGTSSTPATVSLDASLSSQIYGNSETVQPASSNWLLYYKVGDTIVNESQINVGNVLSDLQQKADVNLSNTTPSAAFQNMSVGWGMPDWESCITLAVTMSPFTVPKDGWLYISLQSQSKDTYMYWKSNLHKSPRGGALYAASISLGNATNTEMYPVQKDEILTFEQGGGTEWNAYYIPLKGGNQ